MHAHLGMLTVGVHTISRYESIVGVVEHIDKTLVERQTGTQHSGNQQVFLWQLDIDGAQWCCNSLGTILQGFRQLVGHHLAHTLDVMTEQQTVLLVVLVSQLRHVQIDNRIGLAKIYYFNHILTFLRQKYKFKMTVTSFNGKKHAELGQIGRTDSKFILETLGKVAGGGETDFVGYLGDGLIAFYQ